VTNTRRESLPACWRQRRPAPIIIWRIPAPGARRRTAQALGALSAALACALIAPVAAGAAAPAPSARSALILFLSGSPLPSQGAHPPSSSPADVVEAELTSIPAISLALMSPTEGVYRREQLLLDLGQGDRVEYGSYRPAFPPALTVTPVGSGAQIQSWAAVLSRAAHAPQLLDPGLLASSIAGGAGYAPANAGDPSEDAILAANRRGRVARVSLGPAGSLLSRIAQLRRQRRLVVADLPDGTAGYGDLRRLAATRAPGELLIAIERAPDSNGNELLWLGVAGIAGRGELTSQTTEQRGLVSAIDVPATVLTWLGVAVPSYMRGRVLHTDGPLNGASLRSLGARLRVVYGRRLPTLLWLAVACALLGALLAGLGRAALALRICGLAWLWTPVTILLPAALEPSAPVEYLLVAGASLLVAALTDRLLRWPRALIAPAVTSVVVLVADALAHTQLLIRSVLGPNPIYGARFYGIGNELKSALAVLVFAGVAALLFPADRSRRGATVMAAAGVLLAIVEGSARLGAGVGGVILVCAGTAVAVIVLAPGRPRRGRLLLALATPLLGLAALALLDLLTAHGSGHFTGSVLHARSAGDLRDLIVRRYADAWNASRNGVMPEVALAAVGLVALGVLLRRRIYGSQDRPIWHAALGGGLTAGLVGTLVEDSGTLLWVVAVIALAAVTAYLHGGLGGAGPLSPAPTSGVDDADEEAGSVIFKGF
jgi:hypothetical protein